MVNAVSCSLFYCPFFLYPTPTVAPVCESAVMRVTPPRTGMPQKPRASEAWKPPAPPTTAREDLARGVCAHLIQYEEVVSRPTKRWERRLEEALACHDGFVRRVEGSAEAAALVRDARFLRHMCRRAARNAPSCARADLVLSVYGFASMRDRDTVLRLVRYALQPRVLWAAEVGDASSGKWEAVLVLDMWRWPVQFVFGGRDEFVELLEKFLVACRQSIGVVELPSWNDPSTLAALQRVQSGRLKWGNLLCDMNRAYLLQHELATMVRERERERAVLRGHTDLYFSADNMVYLLRELQATQTALEQTRNTLILARDGARSLEVALQTQTHFLERLQTHLRELSVQEGALAGIEPRIVGMRDLMTEQAARAAAVQGVANAVLAETMLRVSTSPLPAYAPESAPASAPASAPLPRDPPPPPPEALPSPPSLTDIFAPLPRDPLTAPPLGPREPTGSLTAPLAAPLAAPRPAAAPAAPGTRFLRMSPQVVMRVLPRHPTFEIFDHGMPGSGAPHDPIEVD